MYLVPGGVLSTGGVLSPRGVYLVLGGVLSPRGHVCPGGMRRFFRGGMRGFFRFFGCIGYNEIQSMSGRYASYWNAFLFTSVITLPTLFNVGK